MYRESAFERINNINWIELGTKGNRDDAKLVAEFLRRMAVFSIDNFLELQNPLIINVAKELGDREFNDDIVKYCNKETQNYLEDNMFMNSVIKSYLQLSQMADKSESAIKYLEIYNPLIRLFEKGADFVFRKGHMDVSNVGSFPLHNWINRANNEPIDINQL